ncbi:MAG: ABC transporter substrate-binding protein [Dehalococcoides mccartyi]|uniref:ABC transporter substrate-binding protein n=1 Tax=Dehalococcoides mccartyi TaxID=61435 RepID=UPI0030F9F12A
MKKVIPFILALSLVACTVAGCGDSQTDDPSDNTSTRTITDSVGRTVEIPTVVEKIVPLGNTPRMISYLGLADKVVGLGGMDASNVTPVTAYAYANKDVWANVPLVGTDAAGATDYYPEEIISCDPDVILCSYTKELADEIQTKTGIPVVAVPMGTLFGTDYEDALRLLGNVCGIGARAEAVITYINDCLADLATRTAGIPDQGKPSVLGAAATFKGMHGLDGVYTKYAVFEVISANDVTEGLSNTSGALLIDKEQIIVWNPQYIFLDSGGVGLVRADYNDNPGLYTQLTAVQSGNLYQYPSSTSYYSNLEIPIVNAYYVASLLYPEQFSDIDFNQKANEIFSFFLGIDNYLSILESAGAGYGKVTLG